MAGWLLWEAFPYLTVIAGTLVVIGSNLLINWRDTHPSPAGTVDP